MAPFTGESDIRPKDGSFNPVQVFCCSRSVQVSSRNVHRIWTSFLPPSVQVSPPQIPSEGGGRAESAGKNPTVPHRSWLRSAAAATWTLSTSSETEVSSCPPAALKTTSGRSDHSTAPSALESGTARPGTRPGQGTRPCHLLLWTQASAVRSQLAGEAPSQPPER